MTSTRFSGGVGRGGFPLGTTAWPQTPVGASEPTVGSLCTPFARITLSEAEGRGEGCPCRGFVLHHQEEEELESSLLEPEAKEHIDQMPPRSRINLSLSLFPFASSQPT